MRKNNTVMFTKYKANLLSRALKQTKTRPWSSGTPFLVTDIIIYPCTYRRTNCKTDWTSVMHSTDVNNCYNDFMLFEHYVPF